MMRSGTGLADLDGLVVDTARDFRVHERVYTDPEIFDAEIDRIFGSTWVYVAHETEIPDRGDYKTTTIGRQPVIVVRDDSGRVRVFLNRCRHRGSIVCREEGGNARSFQCPYHGWIYANDGGLRRFRSARAMQPISRSTSSVSPPRRGSMPTVA
jgi:phenylpropionate dioxygenase-like ring-hydroxylating dioxygenase large terminal subunit